MAESAITFLLEEMKEIKKWHSKLISGSENEFMELCKDLHELKNLIVVATNDSKMAERLISVERRVRDVVLDIGDAIEDCLLNADQANNTMMMSVFRRHHDPNRFSVGKTIRHLRINMLKPLLDEVKRNILQHTQSFGSSAISRQEKVNMSEERERQLKNLAKSESMRQEKFVGFKDEEDALLSKLVEQKEELGVIAIYGVDGSGKTTLAKKIFENEKIWLEFPTRIWIPASKGFNSRDVFLSILKRFIGDNMSTSNSTDGELAWAVNLCLAEEKFLLVIDDLRSRDVWRDIREALPHSNASGKVLITTRDLSMAKDASSVGPHMLRSLRDEESLELLRINLKGCSVELVDGEKIAKVCRGLPLAVVVLGGNIVDMFMKKNAGCSPDLKKLIDTAGLLELSYDRLSGYLKACFLYLAVFPEDQYIPTRTLTQLWIAEGFIPLTEGKMLEETAEECLDELIRRKLVMVDSVNPIGEVKTCRLHNVIREFARSKAFDHHSLQEILKPQDRVLEKTTRLCLHSDLTKFLLQKPKLGKRVRSLYCFHSEPVRLDSELESTISDAFKSLRVLDSKFTEFPAWITKKLIHLRYVTLSIAALTVVPATISQLFNLQTLVVETKSRTIAMKANIWRMYRLRHLQTKAAIVLDTKWEGKAGESLQTVGRLSPESCTDDFSERASNLKKLAIRGKLAIIFKNINSLLKLNLLQDLKLVNDDLSPSDMAPSNDLPPRTHFPRTLKKLTLSNTFLKWEHMFQLADIQTLEVLKLKENAFTGIHWSAVDYSFPKLQILLITNTDLVHWEASANSFPQLSSLVIKKCENLNEIPKAVFKNLYKLDMERVGKYAVQSATKIAKSKASTGFKLSVC